MHRSLAAHAHSSATEIGRACKMTAAEVRARFVMLRACAERLLVEGADD